LSVSLVEDAQARHILGAQISRIGAFGYLAALSGYKRFKSGRGRIAGQSELKKLGYDTLFILNHLIASNNFDTPMSFFQGPFEAIKN
jgi:hypothetical protein